MFVFRKCGRRHTAPVVRRLEVDLSDIAVASSHDIGGFEASPAFRVSELRLGVAIEKCGVKRVAAHDRLLELRVRLVNVN